MRNVQLLLILLIFNVSVSAQHKREWSSLFNGRNLSGWNHLNGELLPQVQRGELIFPASTKSSTGKLLTNNEFSNFILELELMVVENANGVISFQTQPDANQGYKLIINNAANNWNGSVYCEAGRGWLYTGELNPMAATAYKPGQWNHLRIERIGNNIRTWINNVPVAHVIDDNHVAGFIALQVDNDDATEQNSGEVRFKNIRIKTANLKPTETPDIYVVNLIPNTLSKSEVEQGWKLLFDGKTSDGWVNVYNNSSFPEEGWVIQHGMIAAVPDRPDARVRGACIVTTEKFRAFELQFEFNYAEGANSGVKYGLGNGGVTIGLEYQILDDKRHPDANGGTLGNRRLSSLYDLIPAERLGELTNGPNEWNYGKVILFPDNRVEHWLNGVKVLEYVRGSSIYNVLVAHSKYNEFKGFGPMEASPILLQYHQDEVKFRSIKIREL
ncbi:3-keto-disaccharide hydrolase [Alkaliflexus imshenetskii]|uniref:3-keto-disaccharide hydrolase n=1 Tax=Alkaliflexus imshenetskii TaxID=286730 RepID=UPI000478DAEA|nr:DUF1080 domain-containing protein [Alkaliflexus imshenetskii]